MDRSITETNYSNCQELMIIVFSRKTPDLASVFYDLNALKYWFSFY